MSEYISSSEAATKWGLTRRRVSLLCAEGRIPGAKLVGRSYIVPADAEKPADARHKANKPEFAKGGESE